MRTKQLNKNKKVIMCTGTRPRIMTITSPERLNEILSEYADLGKDETEYSVKDITEIVTEENDIEIQIIQLLSATVINHSQVYEDGDYVCIDIDGDWKHDHHAADFLMEEAFSLKCEKNIPWE